MLQQKWNQNVSRVKNFSLFMRKPLKKFSMSM